MSFFSDAGIAVDLDSNWRRPQRGAIGALLAYFSLGDAEPPLVSIPTGTGKTALALIAPFLANPRPRRVLLVEPSIELRQQVAREAETLQVLKRIGTVALDAPLPRVLEVAGRVQDWNLLLEADFVVAHPNSISPAHYEADPPPRDLFDMIVVDEAHHLAAPTWHRILEYFQPAYVLLLTATPFRRDGRRIPAHIAYHYPMKNALAEGVYHRVEPILLDVPLGATREEIDAQVASIAHGVLQRPEHETSSLLIRGSSKQRAEHLAAMYSELGVPTEVLHSGLGDKRRAGIIARLRTGEARAVAVVGMLAEGFDLPRLRVAAYHDKHRSTPATIQLIGRLARVDPDFPQGSILIVARDADVFPELQGTVRDLYEEELTGCESFLVSSTKRLRASSQTSSTSMNSNRTAPFRLRFLHP